MRYGETWPTGGQSGGPAVTTPTTPAARPGRDRHARVLAYEMTRVPEWDEAYLKLCAISAALDRLGVRPSWEDPPDGTEAGDPWE